MKLIGLLNLVLTLMFAAGGCERKLAKSSESAQDVAVEENRASVPQAEKREADVTDVNELNKSFFRVAADGEVVEVKLLLSKGINVNTQDDSGDTALHHAAWGGRKEVVEVLLINGADMSLKNNDCQTALDAAMEEDQKEIAELLVAKGAKVTIHVAAFIGDIDKVNCFIKAGIVFDIKDKTGHTPLYWAVSTGQEKVAELLISKGADVNTVDESGSTPLHSAVSGGNRAVAELLIAAGAAINVKGRRDRTPLHNAVMAGHSGMVQLLIANGADANSKNDNGETPLHLAFLRGHKDMAVFLISKGADVNVKDQNGRTLLHRAAERGHDELAEILITNGADVNAQDNFGEIPLHFAAVKDHKDIAELLLTNGASVDAKNNVGRTPLHYAAGAGYAYGTGVSHNGIVHLLLNRGADINAKDRWGWTPLHYATRHRHKSAIELLIHRGADLNITDERGRTVFSLIQEMRSYFKADPRVAERLMPYKEIADFLRQYKSVYFVAPDGKDSCPGTLERPFRTITAGISTAEAGDTIFVRGGVYNCASTIHIDRSGEQGKPIRLRAYPGETPIFDFSTAQGDGFSIRGAYWHLKGLTVTGTSLWGIRVEYEESHHNILEQISAYANGMAGVFIQNGPACNLVLNCDSYRNFDQQTNGSNADGFNAAESIGRGNVFIGCRAWNNSDDGFDFLWALNDLRIESCYACRNCENIWNHPCFTGNANGFKLNHGEIGTLVLIRCVAWDHGLNDFDLGNSETITLHNCTEFGNKSNIAYYRRSSSGKVVIRNSVSFNGTLRRRIDPNMDDRFNSWNTPPGIEITEEDFLSLDDTTITGPRNPDGSIPESDFLRLAPGSDAIDAGVDVGLPFVGKAPDLGAFEHDPDVNGKRGPEMLHQAVRDYDVERIRRMLAEGADVNKKDWLGYAPLHWASYFGYPDVTNLLISQGANPNLLSDTGRTPLEIAKAMEYTELAKSLRKHGARE